MSGLLDKANKTAAETTEEPKESSEAILAEASSFDSGNGLNMAQLKFQIGAAFGFLVTMILVFFIDTIVLFGEITLDDFFVPGIILWWLVFNGEDLKQQSFDAKKLVASGVGFLVVTALFAGVAIFSASGNGVTIANIEYDGDNDEIDISFYGPKGMDYTVEVLVDGKVEHTHDATINIDKGSHSVDLDDFWKGNSEDMTGKELIEYEIKVTSNDGEDSMTFDDIMNREVDTAFISVQEKYTYDSGGENKIYEGIYIEMIVGIGSPNADFDFANGVFTGTVPQPIESDWTAEVRVLGGDQIVEYDITADEGVANGYGDFNFDWVSLHMDGGYLEKGDFYGSDGCYTFEITIANEHGDTFVSTDSQIRFYWDDNEASNGDQPAEAC
jgi:hypothetical protein|tara:strand:+ start:30 stop:1184 length:1155 start_codon:yes stop_codon:yes gene_type:complete